MTAEAHAKAALSRRCILTGFTIALAALPARPRELFALFAGFEVLGRCVER
jgi:hypothetical protein